MVAARDIRCAEETDTGFCAPKVATQPGHGTRPRARPSGDPAASEGTPSGGEGTPGGGQRLSGQRGNPHRGRPIGPRREPQRDYSPTGNPTAWRPGALLNPPGHAELTSNTRTSVFCAASSTHPHISNAAARALSRFFRTERSRSLVQVKQSSAHSLIDIAHKTEMPIA